MSVTKEYDELIKASAAQWIPEWSWLYLKAQWYAESLLDINAVSPVGAEGPCQFMPETWSDVKSKLRYPFNASPKDPQYAFNAGAYYMAVMRSGWSAKRSEEDRAKLARSSYNAGFGNLLEAQKLSGGKPDYASIIAKLPEVTGVVNAKQTTDYVVRIERYYQQFKAEEAT